MLLFGAKKDAWFTIYCYMRLYAVILILNISCVRTTGILRISYLGSGHEVFEISDEFKHIDSEKTYEHIVDGQQRLNAIFEFISGQADKGETFVLSSQQPPVQLVVCPKP